MSKRAFRVLLLEIDLTIYRYICNKADVLPLPFEITLFLVGSVLLIFSVFLFCVVFYCFVCLRHASCVSNVSGLFILDLSLVFSLTFISIGTV